MMDPQEFDTSEDGLFYFETDHLALKGNKDYSEVLKTLLILCAQRKQAVKDFNKAVELKNDASADPLKVLEKIVNGESLGMPDMHTLPELPVIDWSKYNVKIPEETFNEIYSGSKETVKKQSPVKKQKVSHEKWTPEEQKRLEELLQIYPPEPIEMRRFKKIADALGNRTLQQVCSRVQKYFLKLYKAGLPIPGRIPKYAERNKKTSLHKHQRHNHYLWKPTTFFPDLCVPVVMNDLENVPGPSTNNAPEIPVSHDQNYLIPTNYLQHSDFPTKSEDELQLELLKRIRKVKINEQEATSLSYLHQGFKCNYCGEEPMVGTRWHCSTCTTDSVDFCTDCILAQLYSENCHPFSHNFITFNDKDPEAASELESNMKTNMSDFHVNNESSYSSESDSSECSSDNDKRSGHQNKIDDSILTVPEVPNDIEKMDFHHFHESEPLYEEIFDSTIVGDITEVSCDYLDSGLIPEGE